MPTETQHDERIREAWSTYRDRLADVDGDDYDAAEQDAWDRLQDDLVAASADAAAPREPPAS